MVLVVVIIKMGLMLSEYLLFLPLPPLLFLFILLTTTDHPTINGRPRFRPPAEGRLLVTVKDEFARKKIYRTMTTADYNYLVSL